MNIDVINECIDKKLSFPEAIKRLIAIGVERYHCDLVRMEKIYYSHEESYAEHMPIENRPKIADHFEKDKLVEALREVQSGAIEYNIFIKQIIAAGVVAYTVYITGKYVIYTGCKGEAYIEKFPF